MKFLVKKIRQWLLKILKKDFDQIEDNMRAMFSDIATLRGRVDTFQGALAADWCFHEPGFIVAALRTPQGDRVKILKLKHMDPPAFIQMLLQIEENYCVRLSHVDASPQERRIIIENHSKYIKW